MVLKQRVSILFWEKPQFFRLNVDGSSIGTAAGGGVVLRDSAGEVIFAASIFFGAATNVYAEILALEHGLSMCLERGFRSIQIDTDSLILVNMLTGITSKPWRYRSQLEHITQLLQTTASNLRHQFREVNAVADSIENLKCQ